MSLAEDLKTCSSLYLTPGMVVMQVGKMVGSLMGGDVYHTSGCLGPPGGSGPTGYGAILCPIPNYMGSNFRYGLQIYSSCLNKPQMGQGE